MRRLLPFVLLLGFGCGDGAPKPEIASSIRTKPPPPVPAPGMAEGAGKQFKSGCSIAFWDEEESEVVIGFLESEPTAEVLNTIKEKKDLFFAGRVPMIEVRVKFEMKNGVPDIAAPIWYRVDYSYFPNLGAMSFVEYADSPSDWGVQITGDPTSGGRVKGRSAGAPYNGPEKEDYYGWNLSFDLPVY